MLCIFHVCKRENDYIEDSNALRILWVFMYLFRWGRGCTNACICIYVYVFDTEPLDGVWWNLVLMKNSRSLTCFKALWPDPPRSGSRLGSKLTTGVLSSRNFLRPHGYSIKPNAWQWSGSTLEEALLFLVPFRSQIFDAFLTPFWTF